MWTLQIFLPRISQPMNLAFEEEAAAKTVMEYIKTEQIVGKDEEGNYISTIISVLDQFGTELSFDLAEGSPVLRLENGPKFMEAHIENSMEQQRANAKLQKKIQGDPTLKFLLGQGQQPMFRG